MQSIIILININNKIKKQLKLYKSSKKILKMKNTLTIIYFLAKIVYQYIDIATDIYLVIEMV